MYSPVMQMSGMDHLFVVVFVVFVHLVGLHLQAWDIGQSRLPRPVVPPWDIPRIGHSFKLHKCFPGE